MYGSVTNQTRSKLTLLQFRVLSATEGKVEFELDIQKDHTVCLTPFYSRIVTNTWFRTVCRPFMAVPSPASSILVVHLPSLQQAGLQLACQLTWTVRSLLLYGYYMTDLLVTYLSPGGRTGDVLKGTATLDKIGKTLAFTQVTFTNSKGQLAARGSHTKWVQLLSERALYTNRSRYVTGTMGEAGPYVAPAEFSDVD